MDIECASFRAYDGALWALRHLQASGLSHSEQAVEPSWTPPFYWQPINAAFESGSSIPEWVRPAQNWPLGGGPSCSDSIYIHWVRLF
jgi:hypothetical protein